MLVILRFEAAVSTEAVSTEAVSTEAVSTEAASIEAGSPETEAGSGSTETAAGSAEAEFLQAAHVALRTLAERPGYLRGQLARAYDDPTRWCLVTEWESVGAYRRALGAYEVKVHATPLLARALNEPSAYEPLAGAAPGGPVEVTASDLRPLRSRP